jgi:hypothetical protein
MDRIIDLDAAAAEIEQRRPGWLATELHPGPTTWRESTATGVWRLIDEKPHPARGSSRSRTASAA